MVPSRRVAIVQVTDLVAHAKVSDVWGSVFVTDATTGFPVRGARVTTRDSADRIMATGETDTSGVARLEPIVGRAPSRRERPASRWGYEYSNPVAEARVVEVVHGADRSFVTLDNATWSRLDAVNRLGGQLDRTRLAHASAFTDRAIYRPGEMVYLTSILRVGAQASLRAPARGDSVRLVVKRQEPGDGTQRVMRDTVLRLGAYGTAADSFKLGAAAPLGSYQVHVEAFDAGWQMAGTSWFSVAEYRAPEFETKVEIDSGIKFRGDVVRAHASSRYYFGAPMGGAVVRWSAMTSDARGGVSVPGLPEGYAIGRSYAGGPEHIRPARTPPAWIRSTRTEGRRFVFRRHRRRANPRHGCRSPWRSPTSTDRSSAARSRPCFIPRASTSPREIPELEAGTGKRTFHGPSAC